MSGPETAVLCGAGVRGHFVYGGYARRQPDRLGFVAAALSGTADALESHLLAFAAAPSRGARGPKACYSRRW